MKPSLNFSTSKKSLQDRISFFRSPAKLRPTMVKVVASVQDDPPEVQILSIAATLVALCDGSGLEPHDIITRIRSMESQLDHHFATQFSAMKSYAEGELKTNV